MQERVIDILDLRIKHDISLMNKKILDINLISDNENEFTFFNIDDEEANETLKALKKTYVTANSKEETILKLKQNSKTQNHRQSYLLLVQNHCSFLYFL